ncbi:hypothetical protein GCM10028773_21650 [Spirosoma koreense]
MRKRLTPDEKKQYVVKQTLTSREIERLENNPNARPVSHSELEALLAASRPQTPA